METKFTITKLEEKNYDYVNSILMSNQDTYGSYESIASIVNLGKGKAYQIFKGDKLCAFFVLFPFNDDKGNIKEMSLGCVFVKKAFRRQGVFNAIIDYTIRQAKMLDINAYYLNASVNNEVANAIYSRKFRYFAKKFDEGYNGMCNYYMIYTTLSNEAIEKLIKDNQ